MAIYELREDECSEASRSTVDEPRPQCLIGKGTGSQYYTHGDASQTGIWLQDVYEVENGFKDSLGVLPGFVTDQYVARQQDYQWKVTTDRKLILMPGDFIKFYPKHEAPIELSVITYERNSDNELIIELGARQPTNSDAWEISQDISAGYSADYMLESHEEISVTDADFYINDVAHFNAPLGSLSYTVPDNVLDADLNPIITFDLDINLKTAKLLTIGSCAVELKTDETYRRYGNIICWSPGVEIQTIDVTTWLTAGESNEITIGVYMAEEYSETHAAYTDHPVLTATGNMKFWKRRDL